MKPILCIDFDGVIHDYKDGWKDGTIYGSVTPGFFDWAEKASALFRLTVYSSRSKTPEQRKALGVWITHHQDEWLKAKYGEHNRLEHEIPFQFAAEKPAAYLTIDDRCICFGGDWGAPELEPAAMRGFVPWAQRPGAAS